MTIAEAMRIAAAGLAAAGIEGAGRDVRLLMAEALGCAPDRVTLRAPEPVPQAAARRFRAMVAARAERRPVSQILGRRAFWGRVFAVSADVLDPRPETETLVAAALAGRAPARILDLGTGSGALLLTLLAELPEATGLGTDLSSAALAVAAANAAALGLAARAAWRCTDWTDGIEGRFDLVVSNPPYIPEAELASLPLEVRDWEPRAALTPGASGLEAYRRIVPDLSRLLAPGGQAFLEHGAGQEAAVAALCVEAGFTAPLHHHDMDGRPRVVELRVLPEGGE